MPSAQTESPFFSLPDRARIRSYLFWGTLQTIWFWLVYAGCNWITSQRHDLLRVHFEFEESWPFVPGLIWVYSSIYLLMIAIPFVIDSPARLTRLALAMIMATGLAGVCFLLFPAEPDFVLPVESGKLSTAFRLSDLVNLDYNQVPSLHVALTVICGESLGERAKLATRWCLRFWGAAVGAAAVLTWQHHLVDVVTGFGLGLICNSFTNHRLFHRLTTTFVTNRVSDD